jgi:16S rRNA (guanine(966)-N(2))-methyltransferase RsmD
LRIIAGTLKGRRLKTPTWEGLRPTSDKLRETLFNVLAPRIAGARVLDGYAGTGAMGIEALSRGAASVTFVEQDRRALALVEENLVHCGITSGCAIIRASVSRALADLGRSSAAFDIIIFDPPYGDSGDEAVATARTVVAPSGVIVLEHATRQRVPEIAGGLARTRQIASGDSTLSFYTECPP